MLLLKKGFPEEGDLVLCTVTKIYFNSVFVKLDEYDKPGMIHISEISPGRIRNINDFVTPDKKIVCKVIEIDKKKGHIDLSLRRVNEIQKRSKIDEIKQEQKAEMIVQNLAKELKADTIALYTKIIDAISKKYELLYPFFQDISTENTEIGKFEINAEIAAPLEKIVKERIKPPIVEIHGEFTLKSYAPDGVDIVKAVLEKALKKDCTVLKYVGGGRYSIVIRSPDYKEAEKILKSMTESVMKSMEKHKGVAEFKRIE